MKGLTVGRMVHYIDLCRRHSAAIVTQVIDKEAGLVRLAVFGAEGGLWYPVRAVRYSETPETRGWHWIERED